MMHEVASVEQCSLCKQDYHGVVCCALGWACWKTYLGRPERIRFGAWRWACLGRFTDARLEEALAVERLICL